MDLADLHERLARPVSINYTQTDTQGWMDGWMNGWTDGWRSCTVV